MKWPVQACCFLVRKRIDFDASALSFGHTLVVDHGNSKVFVFFTSSNMNGFLGHTKIQ